MGCFSCLDQDPRCVTFVLGKAAPPEKTKRGRHSLLQDCIHQVQQTDTKLRNELKSHGMLKENTPLTSKLSLIHWLKDDDSRLVDIPVRELSLRVIVHDFGACTTINFIFAGRAKQEV